MMGLVMSKTKTRAEIAQNSMARIIDEVIDEREHPVRLVRPPRWNSRSREWTASLTVAKDQRTLDIRFKQRRTRVLTKRSVLNALENGLTGIGLESAK